MDHEGKEKDIILMVDGGGMAAIFAAGALEVIDAKVRERVRAVYATSAGAEMGIYFVSGQADVPPRFTMEYLTRPEFIPGNLLRHLYKIFVYGGKSATIPDYINIDYYIPAAQSSTDCVLDFDALERSAIDFFVKVLDIDRIRVDYLPTKDKDTVPDKLRATSQCGPFSTKVVEVDGKRYIDGGTIYSDIDVEMVRQNPNIQFVFIESTRTNFISTVLLYPLYVVAGLAIMRLYGTRIGATFIKELFRDKTGKLAAFPNVVFIRNTLGTSTFCQNKMQLREAYKHGRGEAERVLKMAGLAA